MAMLVRECVNVLSAKLRASLFWLETETGQLCSATVLERAEMKGGSMSVAWILRSLGAEGEVRMRRVMVPDPQALSWMIEPAGMLGMRERLCAANWAVTRPPVVS